MSNKRYFTELTEEAHEALVKFCGEDYKHKRVASTALLKYLKK